MLPAGHQLLGGGLRMSQLRELIGEDDRLQAVRFVRLPKIERATMPRNDICNPRFAGHIRRGAGEDFKHPRHGISPAAKSLTQRRQAAGALTFQESTRSRPVLQRLVQPLGSLQAPATSRGTACGQMQSDRSVPTS